MTGNPLTKKLQLKPGHRAHLINAPEGYRAALEPLPEGLTLTDATDGDLDFVQLFVKHRADLEQLLPSALDAVKPDGLLWITYLKGGARAGTDLNRDSLRESVAQHGLAAVSLVAVDEMWSALRFRPADRVGR